MSRPSTRPAIAGPDAPEPPFPLKLRGPVVRGFGRGSKELGIPTANIPLSGLSIGGHDDLASGIYYGWCALDCSTVAPATAASSTTSTCTSAPASESASTTPDRPLEPSSNHAVADLLPRSTAPPAASASAKTIYPTVLSIGYNPFYANTTRSIEIHIMASFDADFYGAELSLVVLGFIRPEYDYVSKEALVEDIREDIRVAGRSLEREAYQRWREDGWLVGEGEGTSERGADGV